MAYIYKPIFEVYFKILFQDAAQLEIQAQCAGQWNSVVVSGTYKAVGAYGDFAIYEKQTMDANNKWWFFFYDTTTGGWEFSFSDERVLPGVGVSLVRHANVTLRSEGTTISPYYKPG